MALAQIFNVNVPVGGPSQIGINAVYLYFSSVSNTNGIDIQIREVANGAPTLTVVKDSRVTVTPGDRFANGQVLLQSSSDGSAWTMFEFAKPVLLKTQAQYALFVLPHASDPKYVCWGAKTSDQDQVSKVPIQFNQAVGPLLFCEAGDQTATTSQAIKFLIENVSYNEPYHHDDHFNFNEEHIVVNEFTNNFVTGEMCFMSNNQFNLATTTLNSNTAAFITGETVYQSNGSANIAAGVLYSGNSQILLLSNCVGTFDNNYSLVGSLSASTANLNIINTSVVVSTTSNNITLPFTGNNTTSIFYANETIYLTSNDTSISEVFLVSSVSPDKKTLQLSWPPSFSDSSPSIGQVRGDGMTLHALWQGYDGIKLNNFIATFNNSTANTQINQYHHFANSENCFIFGLGSQSRCTSYGTVDLEYHYVVPHMVVDQAVENEHKFYWGGYRNWKSWVSNYPVNWRYIKK